MMIPLPLLIAPVPSRLPGQAGPGIQPGLAGSSPLSDAAMVLAHPERPRAAEQPVKLDPLLGAWTFQPAHSGNALLDDLAPSESVLSPCDETWARLTPFPAASSAA